MRSLDHTVVLCGFRSYAKLAKKYNNRHWTSVGRAQSASFMHTYSFNIFPKGPKIAQECCNHITTILRKASLIRVFFLVCSESS